MVDGWMDDLNHTYLKIQLEIETDKPEAKSQSQSNPIRDPQLLRERTAVHKLELTWILG